ncbi:hypothetical protein [Methylomagnum ishizawai]|uniref:hypothetical protein n=1 Tax=Methylomagnum ishizawai TaxID=1760988 RepID=UPI001C324EAC|nr:hypothetical protein [Methylomagnum ishizawai]BBL74151.1 hypothetical protein MishRS11D_12490 [Methylomagnum ishizawai]
MTLLARRLYLAWLRNRRDKARAAAKLHHGQALDALYMEHLRSQEALELDRAIRRLEQGTSEPEPAPRATRAH